MRETEGDLTEGDRHIWNKTLFAVIFKLLKILGYIKIKIHMSQDTLLI